MTPQLESADDNGRLVIGHDQARAPGHERPT